MLSTLLAEVWKLIRRRDYRAFRCLVGTAPVTRQSGKSRYVMRRRASSRKLAGALYRWGRATVLHDPVSKARYARGDCVTQYLFAQSATAFSVSPAHCSKMENIWQGVQKASAGDCRMNAAAPQ